MDIHKKNMYKAAIYLERSVACDIERSIGVTGQYVNDLKTSIDTMILFRQYLEDYYAPTSDTYTPDVKIMDI